MSSLTRTFTSKRVNRPFYAYGKLWPATSVEFSVRALLGEAEIRNFVIDTEAQHNSVGMETLRRFGVVTPFNLSSWIEDKQGKEKFLNPSTPTEDAVQVKGHFKNVHFWYKGNTILGRLYVLEGEHEPRVGRAMIRDLQAIEPFKDDIKDTRSFPPLI